jgi:hypothetical protein
METKKSIQDIKLNNNNQNIISDIIPVAEIPPIKKRVRKTITKTKVDPEISEKPLYTEPEYNEIKGVSDYSTQEPVKNNIRSNTLTYKRFMSLMSQIKPVYLIILGVIILSLIVLSLLPNKSNKNTAEQSKTEAEMVKKQLSRHIILPQNEQVDIRKITNKMEDPFFKDASIGDYLIILYKNRIAYIFSVDKDIIINAGVVFIDPKTATTSGSSSTTTVATTTKTKQ